jgi:hypothetical protein
MHGQRDERVVTFDSWQESSLHKKNEPYLGLCVEARLAAAMLHAMLKQTKRKPTRK